jgi:hypothetical protein
MAQEEREAQSAKLQELIRRGGPQDLQEANKLMKVMAGYDTRNKTDWRAKAAEEVGRIQQKARILEEMLQGYKPGDQIKQGDVFEVSHARYSVKDSQLMVSQELANALQNAQPKIQKMCEEDSEDHEAVAKLFEINDSIHRTIERYKLFKKGDIEAANNIPQGTLGRSGAGVKQGPNNTLNLIDFGESEPAPQATESSQAPQQPAAKGNALEDDLLGLSLSGDTYGQSGSISLGGSNGSGRLSTLVTHVQFLTLLSSRHVWDGRPKFASAAKAIYTSHHRSLCIRTPADSTSNNVPSYLRWFSPAPYTTISYARSFRVSCFHSPTGLTLRIPAVGQATTTRVRCCRSARRWYLCTIDQPGAKCQRPQR